MKKFLSSTRNVVLVIVAAILVVLIAVFAGLSAYYRTHVLPGTTVAGVSVSGMDREALTEQVQQVADAQMVTVDDGVGQVEVPASDTGVHIAVNPTVDAVFEPNGSVTSTLRGIFSGEKNYLATVSYNEAKFNDFVATLPLTDEARAHDATVGFDGEAFQVTPAVDGQRIDDQSLVKQLQNSVAKGANVALTAGVIDDNALITDADAQAAADMANQLALASVAIDDGEGGYAEPDLATKASWITFKSTGDNGFSAVVDRDAVKKWVNDYASSTNIDPKPGYHNMENGKVVATAVEPTSGWVANNVDDVTQQISDSLQAGESVSATLTYDEKQGDWEEREADPATAGLRYRAAPGEKWIDLDLANNSVTAYEGANVVGGPYPMVPGAPATPTVEGEYNVYLQYEQQTMRGQNVDGSRYETPNVPWVTYFTGSYAFHGAPWRGSFGWSGPGGSHGCVNMPVDAAKFIYDFSEIGTKVISHY